MSLAISQVLEGGPFERLRKEVVHNYYRNESELIDRISTVGIKNIEPLPMGTFKDAVNYVILTSAELSYSWKMMLDLFMDLNDLASQHKFYHIEDAKVILTNCLKELCGKGFNANEPLEECRSRPLHYTALKGCALLCYALIKFGADIEAAKSDSDCFKPLHIAASTGNLSVLELLLKQGAKVDSLAKDSLFGDVVNPLAIGAINPLAAGVSHPKVIQILADFGGLLDPINAMKKAVYGSFPESIEKLFELGVNLTNRDFNTLRQFTINKIAYARIPETCKNKINAWINITFVLRDHFKTFFLLSKYQYGSPCKRDFEFNWKLFECPNVDVDPHDILELSRHLNGIKELAGSHAHAKIKDNSPETCRVISDFFFNTLDDLHSGVEKYLKPQAL